MAAASRSSQLLLVSALREAGIPADDLPDELAGVAHHPALQHLATSLTLDCHLDPDDVELRNDVHMRAERLAAAAPDRHNPRGPGALARSQGDDAGDPGDRELRRLRESVARQEAELQHRRAQRAQLGAASAAAAAQAQRHDTAHRRARSDRLLAGLAARNVGNNRALAAATEPSEEVSQLLARRPEDCLLAAHSLGELGRLEDTNAGGIISANQMLGVAEVAQRLRRQQAVSGALGDTPFGPSCNSDSAGGCRLFRDPSQEPHMRAKVLQEGDRLAAATADLKDRLGRICAQLAGAERQEAFLRGLASGSIGAEGPHELGRLQAEAEALEADITRMLGGSERPGLLDTASKYEVDVGPHGASLVLRRQQRYVLCSTVQSLVQMALAQRARLGVVDVLRGEEHRTLQDLYLQIGDMSTAVASAASDAAAAAEGHARLASSAAAAAATASSSGPAALLGDDAHLCAAYALLGEQAPYELQPGATTTTGLLPSVAAVPSGAGWGFGAAEPGPGRATNPFLQQLMSEPGQQAVGSLAAWAGRLSGALGAAEAGVRQAACGDVPALASRSQQAAEDVRRLLAAPVAEQQQQQGQQQQQQTPEGPKRGGQQVPLPPQRQGWPAAVPDAQQGQDQAQDQRRQPQQRLQQRAAHVAPLAAAKAAAPASLPFPVLRLPAIDAALAVNTEAHSGVMAGIQDVAARYNYQRDARKARPEQAAMERRIVPLALMHPDQLVHEVAELRQQAKDAEAASAASAGLQPQHYLGALY